MRRHPERTWPANRGERGVRDERESRELPPVMGTAKVGENGGNCKISEKCSAGVTRGFSRGAAGRCCLPQATPKELRRNCGLAAAQVEVHGDGRVDLGRLTVQEIGFV